ncbi:protein TOPLESS-like isoform X2 [Solanum pennellii]|uniref:Protein TOPLESS-like isoform X2 n=1 Tax=Solanum pennellii TaxID=28526 RepID=A0ABM1V7R3_SOLPN|nr:protein TOPLESS-like isoform X2 [Solanum pennellii]
MPPPPAATYIAFHPQDNNIITIGMDNSIMSDWVRAVYGALLGGNAEGQILAATGSIDISIRYQSAVHQDQTHFFVVHDAQLAIYEKTKLKCLKQQVSPLPDYSCQLIHASFLDATVCIFTLHMRCRSNIHPVVAEHLEDPRQYARAMSDSSVNVSIPLESGGK